jgi:hypothetical protein
MPKSANNVKSSENVANVEQEVEFVVNKCDAFVQTDEWIVEQTDDYLQKVLTKIQFLVRLLDNKALIRIRNQVSIDSIQKYLIKFCLLYYLFTNNAKELTPDLKLEDNKDSNTKPSEEKTTLETSNSSSGRIKKEKRLLTDFCPI